jgi:uncharacterized protein YndB with AHSA1/START domain
MTGIARPSGIRWPPLFALALGPWMPTAESAEILDADVHHEGDRYYVSLEAQLDAPPEAVFTVITDYDRLAELHRRVRESRVVRRIDDHTVEVYTRVWGCVAAVFCKGMERVERVEETPPTEVRATVIPEQSDLKSGTVRWQLRAGDGGTVLSYESEMDPDFWVPPVLGDRLLQASISRTTREMILRVEERARALVAGGGPGAAGQP